MEQIGMTLLDKLASNGPFVVLFGFLLWYVLRTNDKRETRYLDTIEKNQEVISKLADKYNKLDNLADDLDDMRDDVRKNTQKIEGVANDLNVVKADLQYIKSSVNR